jgi:hypothetical protein
MRQRVEARDRAQVLLAVAAAEHLGEDLVERRPVARIGICASYARSTKATKRSAADWSSS